MKLFKLNSNKSLSTNNLLSLAVILFIPISGFGEATQGNYFQVIATNADINKTIWYNFQNERVELVASKVIRSKDYRYDLGERIAFYGDRLDTEGAPIPEAIAMPPEGASRLLFLFRKLPEMDENGLNYQVFVLNDDTLVFPFGSFKFINMSSLDTAIKLGDEKFSLNVGESRCVVVAPPEVGDIRIRILAKDPRGVAWTPSYSNGWGHRTNLRTLVFIVDAMNGGLMALRYREFEPKE